MVLITNHFERAISLLASQFRFNKPDGSLTNLQKLIKALVIPAQELEDVNYQLLTLRWLSTAQGVQLDEIGVILGLPRNPGESDSDYRERLQFQIFINTSSGTPEQVIETLKFLTDASYIDYYERNAAFYEMYTDGTKFPYPPNDLNTAIKRVSPAGVNYVPITASYGADIVFIVSNDVSSNLLEVNPDINDPNYAASLELEPYNKVLYVDVGSIEDDSFEGGLEELDYPSPWAGEISELIQINGNIPPRRF